MPDTVLVVDDDPDIARFIEVNLRTHGFEVHMASDGVEALERATELRPDLVLVDVMMPRMDGFQVVDHLRSDPRTANTSIIMLTAKALTADKVLGITAGADDYIIKPFDPIELVARVKGALRRAREMRAISPLTGLPGNARIQDEIQTRISADQSFALLYADLDNFKAYNDHYGFLRGDEALRAVARAIQDVSLELGGSRVFVGHLGGDDFVLVAPMEMSPELCEQMIEKLHQVVSELYDETDRDRGYIEVQNRQGRMERFPLLSVSIGVATTDRRHFTHPGELVSVATELKEFAKRTQGSSYLFDRRSDRGERIPPGQDEPAAPAGG
ncbi:MAG: response regulator [Actinomycetota bacterium]|nr:response regulator [Actinomycetota bacterium]